MKLLGVHHPYYTKPENLDSQLTDNKQLVKNLLRDYKDLLIQYNLFYTHNSIITNELIYVMQVNFFINGRFVYNFDQTVLYEFIDITKIPSYEIWLKNNINLIKEYNIMEISKIVASYI